MTKVLSALARQAVDVEIEVDEIVQNENDQLSDVMHSALVQTRLLAMIVVLLEDLNERFVEPEG